MASEIVVGIDFGTTYSGVSWAVNAGNKQIHVVNDWPNPNPVATSEKVPSKITYLNRKPGKWGFEVDHRVPSLSWFKLLLDEKNKTGRGSDKVNSTLRQLEALSKAPEDVAAEYLSLVWHYTKEDIRKTYGNDWETIYSVRAILTVPAIWSESGKSRTLAIAKRAGIPGNVTLVSEPEAAALAVLRERKEGGEVLQTGDCFVVCDAGGGTVDLISYKISSLNPLQVEECAVGDGGLCGSVYLDQGFERYIRTIVGQAQWDQLKPKSKQKMMHEFEISIKRAYAGADKEFMVELQDVNDDTSVGIEGEMITVKPKALQTIFDHVISQIERLVQKQVDEVSETGRNVKAILLVGGFGTNPYLHKRLDKSYSGVGTKVLQTKGGWSSICRGATMWGLEHSHRAGSPAPQKTVKSRIARYSYGIMCAQIFDSSRGHLAKDGYRNHQGEYLAQNQMIWKLRKGEKIEEGRELHVALTQEFQASFRDAIDEEASWPFSSNLYYCADPVPPTRAEPSVKELCKVEYKVPCSQLYRETSFKDKTTGQKWRSASFDFYIRLDNTTLEYFIAYKGEQVAHTEAKYKEDF